MVKDHRVTLTRRHAYRTKSNRVKTIKTPGTRTSSFDNMWGLRIVQM